MKSQSIALNFLLSVSLFCLSFYISWNLNAASNFLYSIWYETLDLGGAIDKYAPDNKFREGFETTSKPQRVELFSGIVRGVQNDGKGLSGLAYTHNNSVETLLTDAEIIHLQDVANLVDKFKYLALCAFVVALLTMILIFRRKIPIKKFKRHLYSGLGLILFLLVILLIMGPTKVFYAGHELIFPNNHQWFFYYEESLMSTMMRAPDLFGPIACQLLLLTILLWLLLLYSLQKFQHRLKRLDDS